MSRYSRLLPTALLACLSGCAANGLLPGAERQVSDTETAFAETMAARDLDAFATFIADDAIFVQDDGLLRGRAAIVDGWRRYFDGATAPFSWRPALVAVLDSGQLALSTGPVYDAAGSCGGTFTSIWRREADGRWRIVFDRGSPGCGER